ncbi:hypothetical protein T07_13761 [Trichinella nelsoni]|uniref:Uncharacterized protein n=1 Tax=Trichinella nelsoni TaxID=6336 RepID=A0A0V0SMZ0_9BILA|nr:hypothetical protein T07_13761 [Trichinella nelsoni]
MLGYINFTCTTGWLDSVAIEGSSTKKRESISQFDEISELDDSLCIKYESSKQSASIVSSIKDDRNFVTKSPAALKLCSAPHDVGGTVIMPLDVVQRLRRQPYRS